MSDLIDRQAAMDTLIERDPSGLDSVLNIIRGLPDARPEVTEEDVIEYCRKRHLCIVDSALFKNHEFAQIITDQIKGFNEAQEVKIWQ